VRVPDIVGLEVPAATAELEGDGLTLGAETERASDRPEGEIIEQSPAFGEEVAEGSSIDYVISTGPEAATVPDLVGLSLDQAVAELEKANLRRGSTEERASSRPEGQVISSDPAAGENVEAGDTVDLVVSNGRQEVPDVRGETEADARQTLTEAGFDVQVTRTETDVDDVVGRVVAQSPTGGSTVPRGATVVLSVAEAAPEPEPQPTPTPTPSATAPATP
jgi:serine/threonine-protein kinase